MKNARILSMIFAVVMPLAAMADSYTSLWKKYDAARAKDHPKTVLDVLGKISEKAKNERAYGQLLKAQVLSAQYTVDVSNDSLDTEIDRIRQYEQAAVASGDKVLASIYQSVLGEVYADNKRAVEDAARLSKEYYAKSMTCPDELAKAYCTGYDPFVKDGDDSKYFYDDMLHVIGIRAEDYRGMHDYYASHGKREAACLTALQIVCDNRKDGDEGRVKKSKFIMSLDSLVHEYSDLVVCGEVAIERYSYMESAEDVTEDDKMNYINYALMKWGAWPRMNILRNAQRRLTLPSFHASLGGELALPDVPRKVVVMGVNNVGELKLTVSRLDIDGTTKLNPNVDADYARLRRHIVTDEQPYTDVRRYVGQPAYRTLRDTLEISGLRSGMYLVEMSTDNVSIPVQRSLLRVCNVYPVVQPLPGDKTRFVVLNATTGTAVANAKVDVVMSVDKNGKDHEVKTLTCDANGEAVLEYGRTNPVAYRVYTDTENAFPRTPMAGRFYYYNNKSEVTRTSLYTDRSIYRPGQTVHVAAMMYKYDNRNYTGGVLDGQTLTLTLRDANHKEVATRTLTTDEYGMAAADFVLPQGGLTGTYTLRADKGGSFARFSVEEYKRPTFKVEMGKAETRYAADDTVSVKCYAKTFAGVPVQGAKVAVSVIRRPAMFWRFAASQADAAEKIVSDTIMTDNDGTFTVRVPIRVPYTYDEHPRRYYSFDVTADVTDATGETRYGEMSLPFSDHPTILTCDLPAKSLRDSLHTVTFAYRNNAGEPIKGNVVYTVDGVKYECAANEAAKLSQAALTSGSHRLTAVCGTDTLTTSYVVFTLDDRKVPMQTHDWFYLSSEQFPSDGSPVYIQVGSSDDVQHVVYTIVSGNKIIEQGQADLHNEMRTRAVTYKEEWGDGVAIAVAWVKNGKAYVHTARIERPLPDTRLNLKWITFRDRLTPGQRETWTLNVTRPDGKPAHAQLLAMMYDKSLDEIRNHNIHFSLPTYVNVPWITWRGVANNELFAYGEMPMRFLREPSLDYSRFIGFSISAGYGEVLAYGRPMLMYSKQSRDYDTKMDAVELSSVKANMKMERAEEESVTESSAANGAIGDAGTEESSKASSQVRENLNETAFFMPGLVTDDKGNISLRFTLPESVTTWQMYGLAHDKEMNNGMISATAVASKTVMIQPNVPRFVRTSDSGIITARVSNTSDKEVSGTARMVLLNPETGREVLRRDTKFTVKAGETTVAKFAFDMTKVENDGLLICRVTATGHGYSDGEQHYLPVLSDKEMVTNAFAFTQNEPGKMDIDLTKLFPAEANDKKLTVEYTNSPAWLMIQALPSMATPNGDNAMSLVTAYYANSIGRNIMLSNDAIRQTVALWNKEDASEGSSLQSALQKNEELKLMVLEETPWLMDADREADQKRQLASFFDESQISYRLASNLSKLSRLQREDGSFAWWKGMDGSPCMTMSVVETLVRLNKLIGEQKATSNMVEAGFAYMDKRMAEEVKDIKKAEAKGEKMRPSELAVQYMYSVSIANRKLSASAKRNFDFLVNRLSEKNTEFTIYGKAVSALVLAKNGYADKAADLLESIRQYTVYKEEMGRYFDTPKALYSWFDYRIPSQVAAIEALQTLQPSDRQTISEMQRWLLQEKRTQAWDTPINSVNAVFAFMNGSSSQLLSNQAQPTTFKFNGQKLAMPKATAGLGYVKVAKTADNMRKLEVEKTSPDTSWGAVYAQFVQPTTEIASAASGMTVVREVLKDGKKVSADDIHVSLGDRITVRLTITAERDYDFVQLTDKRAACLEPLQQTSGYGWGYYCQPKDYQTNYFFSRLSKGKHVVETTYYADRTGKYQTGTCSVQCAYSPEFMARTKAFVVTVE